MFETHSTVRAFRIGSSCVSLVAVLISGCRTETDPASQPPPPKVSVAHPIQRDVVEWDEYTGRLQAVESVEVRAQVSGYLHSIEFEDGATVQKGDLLFVIDPRPYEASLNRARAELELAQARAELARRDLARAQQLLKQRTISEEEGEARSAAAQQAVAAVAAAAAAMEAAALNVEFTRVVAPISGRVGRHLVDKGNLVIGGPANATILTTIVALDPIHCYFEADERSYLKYARLAESGVRPSSREARNPVQVGLADEDGFPHHGWMDFVDNQFDASSGTMTGRAVLDNPARLLTPGMFVRLRLVGSGTYPALLVPDEAVGIDQAEKFVWVIDDSDKAQYRRIQTGPLFEGLRIVRNGLAATDRIVVAGIQRVQPGQPVLPEVVPIPTSSVAPAPTAEATK